MSIPELFDAFASLSDGFEDAVIWKDGWIDDESDYRELIRQVEETEEPLFLFNVTVQNHGGYDTSVLEDKELVEIEEQYAGYDDVIAYLTGIKYSDMALGELIQYFRNSDDPVILCFFGDHQAALDEDFIQKLVAANEDTVQAVNVNGYMKNGTWHSFEEADENLTNYEFVQYYRLLDQYRKMSND